jgi:hypothetical protein
MIKSCYECLCLVCINRDVYFGLGCKIKRVKSSTCIPVDLATVYGCRNVISECDNYSSGGTDE